MVKVENQRISVGNWTVEPGLDRLRCGDTEVSLEPRQMDVLMYLAERPGEVVSADALIAEVWQRVVVGDDAIYHCISRLREALGDDSHHPTYIKTIAKRGYRLIAPVRFVEERESRPDAPEPTSMMTVAGRKRVFGLAGLLALGLLIVAYQYLNVTRTSTSSVPERSIAVLPFVDLSPAGDQEYFADGIAEDLLNALAKVPRLKVAGRTSSFTFRDRNEDIRVIGEVLGVAHIVEGSVRRDGNRVRVTAQLLDVADGFHVWSETYDRELVDIFAVQNEIAASIVEALQILLVGDAQSVPMVRVAADVDAYNLYLLGRHHFELRTEAELEQARAYFEEAIERDPNYAPAYSGLVDTLLFLLHDAYGSLPMEEVIPEALRLIHKALALDPLLPEIHASLGFLRMFEGDVLASEAALKRAIELSPNMARAYNWLYITYGRAARYQEAFDVLERAFRLDPLSPIINTNMAADL